MQTQLFAMAEGAAFAAIVFLGMWVAKQVADLRTRSLFDASREVEAGANLAIGLRRAGLYLGLAIGMTGALSGSGQAFRADAVALLVEGATLIVLLLISLRLTDHVVIPALSNDDAVKDGNVAVGFVELGIAVATGLVAAGAYSGEGGGLGNAILFFALGQAALLLLARVYEQLTPYGVIELVRQGNAAAGLMLGSMLVAFGFIMRASIAGPSAGWQQDLVAFGVSAGGGIALLLLFQWPIDRLFLPGITFREAIERDGNVAAISVAAAVKIALAIVIAAVVV